MSHYKPYPAYKDSAVEWLGQVPAHWGVRPMKGIVEMPITDGPHETPNFIDEGIPFVSAEAVSGGFLNFDKIRGYISRKDHERFSKKYKPRRNDIYMIKSGATTGTTAIVDTDREFNIWSPLAAIRCGGEMEPLFVLNFTRSRSFQEAVALNWSFGTQQNIGMGVIGNLQVTVPPLREQQEIANHLDRETTRIDSLIEKKRRFIELLQEKRQALITQAVTKGLDPSVPMKGSGVEWLGEVPEQWTVRPLKYCLDFQEGPGIMAVDFHDEGIPLLRVSGVKGGYATLEGCNFLDPAKVAKQWSHFRLSEGDLLISGSASMGNVTEVGKEATGAIAYTGLIRLREKDEVMKKDFIRWAMESSLFSTQVDLFKAGSTIQHFGPTHLSQMFLLVPSPIEQAEISSYLESATARLDSIVRKTERSIELLKEHRSALITAAVTGQIDLRDSVVTASQMQLRKIA